MKANSIRIQTCFYVDDCKTDLLLYTFDFTFYLMDIVLEDVGYSHLWFHGVSN